ncbi:ComF family protein [Arthrobacter pityocampae]|uniref:ComF family protein n=2 Tax=Arthrobacter pityocampae TaxID=547334 RepID=A0A2S5J223_9MICC|nr:ComF family protein [Arthrobacter pityocampae]
MVRWGMQIPDPSSVLDRIVLGQPYRRTAAALAAFAALVLPSSCVLCGRWDTSLCPPCSAAFRRATARPFRAEAGAESLPDVVLPDVAPGPARGPHDPDPTYGPLPVVAAGRYGRAVSGVLLAFKNHGHVDLAGPVEAALAGALHEAVEHLCRARPGPGGVRPVLLVPVPGRASSRRRRGYDPLLLLLSRLDRRGGLPAGAMLAAGVRHRSAVSRVGRVLVRGGLVRDGLAALSGPRGGQKGLGRRRRRANVLHSMRGRRDARAVLADRDCIIVDDVLTTGATIGEVHRVLRGCGARVLGAVVIAATSSPGGHDVHDPTQTPSVDVQEVPEWRRVNYGGG